LRVLNTDDEYAPWKIEWDPGNSERVLLTDRATCSIRFIFRQTIVDAYGPGLQLTLAAAMAWQLTQVLTAHQGKHDRLQTEYLDVLRRAKGMDGQEGSPDVFTSTILTTDVRNGG
jgi:hypothetical protein